MPPKKTLKDLQSSPVYTMAHEEQVRLLSDALLREYMHRRGFLDTLKAFDEENPRDEQTISSRALMSDLMALRGEDQSRLKALGIETIMEMLIDLRVEKRMHVQTLQEELQRPIPAVPAEFVAAKAAIEKRKRKKKEKSGRDEHDDSASEEEPDDDVDTFASKTKHKKSKQPRKHRGSGGGDDEVNDNNTNNSDDDDDAHDGGATTDRKRRKHSKVSPASKERGQRKRGPSGEAARLPGEAIPHMTLDELLASDSSTTASEEADLDLDAQGRAPAAAMQSGGGATNGAYLRSVDAPSWLNAEDARGRGEDHAHDRKDEVYEEEEEETLPELSPSVLEGSEPLAAEAAHAACRVLLGPQSTAPPPAFLQQGFVFDNLLEFALIQWKRGPGAALAPIQALVVAFFYEKERYVGVEERQRDALQRALCAILFKAQPDAHNICLVDGRLARSDPCRGFFARMTSHFRAWTGFDNAQEVETKVAELLAHHWSEEKDCGLWCFLTSVVLSRGAAAVASDVESSNGSSGSEGGTHTGASRGQEGFITTLIDTKSGDGTEALANLCLSGRAVCFHHNGAVFGQDGRALRGYTSGVRCGFLDGDPPAYPWLSEATKETLSFSHARSPHFASWVVLHSGHYSNAFLVKDGRASLEQKRALGGKASVEVTYWDALTDDEEVVLTITVDAAASLGLGGGAASASRQANASYVNRALLQVPDWSSGVINWNGHKIIRG